jgi:hypothetical protein
VQDTTQAVKKEHQSSLTHAHRFYSHLFRNLSIGIIGIAIALSIGMIGYHYYENMPWVDAFVNAAMILSGMGPMGILKTEGGKVFAGCYALFSGLFFISMAVIIFSPFVHAFFIKIHAE